MNGDTLNGLIFPETETIGATIIAEGDGIWLMIKRFDTNS